MADPLYRQYLQQARHLAEVDPTRPRQGNLRRAVSTAYYALFHFLIEQASRKLVGTGAQRAPLRHVLARGFAHTEMKAVATSFAGGTLPLVIRKQLGGSVPIPKVLQTISETFVAALQSRHGADYDLSERYARQEVVAHIERVERAVASWEQLRQDPAADLFLIGLLIWNRLAQR